MTNPSPPESQNPIPERRQRPASGVTFDEMIAIIVAFSTIGGILFWSIGRNSRLANNLGLSGGSSLLGSDQTIDTNLGFGNILSGNTGNDANLNQDLEVENRQLASQLRELETPIAYIPPNKKVNLSPTVAQKSFSLDSGAKLVPVAGVAILPGFKSNAKSADTSANIPTIVEAEEEVIDSKPTIAPETTKPAVEPEATKPEPKEPVAITPETTKMPEDVVPDYWAFSFVKQMRDQALVPELAKNQEFDPDALITRASMATLVSQAFDQQPTTQSIKKFKDVTNKNAIAQDIDKAVRTGFMQGYSDNEFRPLENIPRYQVLVTLATGLGLEPSKDADQILQKFSDRSKMPDWAKQQVAAAAEAGLVVNPPGTAQNSLIPERPASRAEVAAMIHQALVNTGKLEPLDSEYIVKP